MPRGGKRLGSGRKPHRRSERWLGGNASRVNLALVTNRPEVAAVTVGTVPGVPAMLTGEEAAYWQLWAPLAAGRGLLTPETEPGFVQLCQVARRQAWLWSEIQVQGFMHEIVTVDGSGQERREYKKHPLMTEWRGLVQRQEQMLARFGLTADGKIAGEVKKQPAESEFAKLMAMR